MHPLRRLLLGHRSLAAAVLALALMVRLAMPAGYMPGVADGRIVVGVCSGTGPVMMVVTIPGLEHGDTGSDEHREQAERPCAFAGLASPSLAAADPVLLAAAIAFVVALDVRSRAWPASPAPPYLRPPLRGPPAVS